MGTDPSQDSGQGEALHDDIQGLLVFPHLGHLDIALDIDLGGTGQSAGGCFSLVHGKGDGHCLGKNPVDGLSFAQPHIPFAGYGYRAHFFALSASGAGLLNIPGVFSDGHGVVADKAADIGYLGIGVEGDVGILGRLHHFGGSDAGGAVQGGKGLVILEHVAPYGG